MKTAGVIAEYDPFHNGHAYHLGKVRAAGADGIVVALGGEFTQRGEPAWCSKYLRAEAALMNGADLVVEIPQAYAMGSAERFAMGGVGVLDALGCVDFLSFGSECGDRDLLERYAAVSDSAKFAEKTREYMQEGISVMEARAKAAGSFGEEYTETASAPNDILGTEYLKWIKRLGSEMDIVPVKRFGAGHGEEGNLKQGMASASYLRSFSDPADILPYVPENTCDILLEAYAEGKLSPEPGKYETAVLARLRTVSEESFASVPDAGNEGLYHRVYDAVRNASGINGLYDLVKTKRYAMTRVKRIVAGAFLGLCEEAVGNAGIPYVHVLGMTERGSEILKEAKRTAKAPVGSSLADLEKTSGEASFLAGVENVSEDLWQTLLRCPGPCGIAYTQGVIKK